MSFREEFPPRFQGRSACKGGVPNSETGWWGFCWRDRFPESDSDWTFQNSTWELWFKTCNCWEVASMEHFPKCRSETQKAVNKYRWYLFDIHSKALFHCHLPWIHLWSIPNATTGPAKVHQMMVSFWTQGRGVQCSDLGCSEAFAKGGTCQLQRVVWNQEIWLTLEKPGLKGVRSVFLLCFWIVLGWNISVESGVFWCLTFRMLLAWKKWSKIGRRGVQWHKQPFIEDFCGTCWTRHRDVDYKEVRNTYDMGRISKRHRNPQKILAFDEKIQWFFSNRPCVVLLKP